MILQVEHRKGWCDRCAGVRVGLLELVDASRRVTRHLVAYVAELCRLGLTATTVADHLGLDPKTVKALDKAAVLAEFGQTPQGSRSCWGMIFAA